MQDAWYYAGTDRSAVGPCSREALEALHAEGSVDADTFVWTQGMENWAPYACSGLNASHGVALTPAVPADFRADITGGPMNAALAALGGPRVTLVDTAGRVEPVIAVGEFSDAELSPRRFRDGRGSMSPDGPRLPDLPVDDDGWQYTAPTPWRRYCARMLDTMLLGTLMWFVLGMLSVVTSDRLYRVLFGHPGLVDNTLATTILTLALAAPLEAWLLGMTGTTLGKWLFGIRVTRPDGGAIGFWRAGRREARVFLQGMALGIPLFSLITLIIAYMQINKNGAAGWDVDKPWVVTGRPHGVAQTVLFTTGVVVLFATLVVLQVVAAARRG